MKKLTDRYKVPRTLLGYIVNSTAAPVCILVPLSTWAVFYSGLFAEQGVLVNGSGMGAYIASIPYQFYGWVAPLVLLLVILGVIPLMGITKKHNQIALETGIVIPDGVGLESGAVYAPEVDQADEDTIKRAKPWNFLIPLAILIVVTLVSDVNVLKGCLAATVAAGILYLVEGKMKLSELFDSAFSGVKSMIFVFVQITLAMALVEINTRLGLSDFVISFSKPILQGAFLPAVVFLVCSAYSYFGGGFWDMAMIMMPIVIPLATTLGVDPVLAGAALISASAFGSTTYVCGDAVMLTSRANDIQPVYQMLGTLPYALISGGISFVLYLIAGVLL